MPSTTASRKYPYPTPDDANDLSYIVQRLAEPIDADIIDLGGTAPDLDTGWLGASPGPGWQAVVGQDLRVRRIGRIVYLTGAVKHTAAASLAQVALIPSDLSPHGTRYIGAAVCSVAVGTNPVVELYIAAGGAISCQAYTTAALNNHILPVVGSYVLF